MFTCRSFLLLGFITAVRANTVFYIAPGVENDAHPGQFPLGTTLVLSVQAYPQRGGPFEWFHNDKIIPGATSDSLQLRNVSELDGGNYRVRTVRTGEISEDYTLNVLQLPPSPLDPTFDASALDGQECDLTSAKFGVGGSVILRIKNLNDATRTVRLLVNGSVDTAFQFPESAGRVLAVLPDSRLVTENAPYLLSATGYPTSFLLPAPLDRTAALTDAVVQGSGKFVVAQGTKLIRFDSNGTVDAVFGFSSDWSARILGLKVDHQDRIYVQWWQDSTNELAYNHGWPVITGFSADGRDAFVSQTGLPSNGGLAPKYSHVEVFPLLDGRLLFYKNWNGWERWDMFGPSGEHSPAWPDPETVSFPLGDDAHIDPAGHVYRVLYSLEKYAISASGFSAEPGFYPGLGSLSGSRSHTVTLDGKLLAVGTYADSNGQPVRRLVRIDPSRIITTLPPVPRIYGSNDPKRGAPAKISSTVGGTGPFGYQWLALDGQPLPPITTGPDLEFSALQANQLGRYQLKVTGPGGTALSHVVQITPWHSSFLANLSGRAVPGAGEDTTIAGFTTVVHAGASGSPLLLRGVGPGLQQFGIANYLPNPVLNLYDSKGTVVSNNDNWGDRADRDTIRASAAAAGAFALGETSLDAALLRTSYIEQFTINLFDASGRSGAGLLEIYRVPDGQSLAELTNLSFRAHTGPGEATAIAGFVIGDPDNFGRSARVLLRVVGPTLTNQGITRPLTNPILTVFDNKGQAIAQNDDWATGNPSADSSSLAATMKQVGAFDLPTNSKDAALLLDLPAGPYTMHATGGEGVVLMEIYLVR